MSIINILFRTNGVTAEGGRGSPLPQEWNYIITKRSYKEEIRQTDSFFGGHKQETKERSLIALLPIDVNVPSSSKDGKRDRLINSVCKLSAVETDFLNASALPNGPHSYKITQQYEKYSIHIANDFDKPNWRRCRYVLANIYMAITQQIGNNTFNRKQMCIRDRYYCRPSSTRLP